jgi:hypothetical protein
VCPGSGLRRQVSGRRRTTSQNKPSAVSYQPQIALRPLPFAIRQTRRTSRNILRLLQRKANGEERKALCFQDFACNPHGLKTLQTIPKTERLFSRLCKHPPEGGARAIRCSLFARRQSPRLLRRMANGEWRKASKNRSLARRGGLVMTNIR